MCNQRVSFTREYSKYCKKKYIQEHCRFFRVRFLIRYVFSSKSAILNIKGGCGYLADTFGHCLWQVVVVRGWVSPLTAAQPHPVQTSVISVTDCLYNTERMAYPCYTTSAQSFILFINLSFKQFILFHSFRPKIVKTFGLFQLTFA